VMFLHENPSQWPKTSYSREQRLISLTFWYIKPSYVDRVIEHTCDTIKGTREVHSIRSIGAIDVNKLLGKKNWFVFAPNVWILHFRLVKVYLGPWNGRLKC
jgi:hypothetical protein